MSSSDLYNALVIMVGSLENKELSPRLLNFLEEQLQHLMERKVSHCKTISSLKQADTKSIIWTRLETAFFEESREHSSIS